MGSSDEIRRLELEHQSLDSKINSMSKTGVYDDAQLRMLKKQKLVVRDRLASLRKSEYDENQRTGYGDE